MSKYFFIGIGGISMSAIALILKRQGHIVEGSDILDSSTIQMLRKNQINVYIGHNQKNIKGNEIVIYTAAIAKDNPELVRAKELGLKIYERAQFLGMLMKDYKNVIAISGTHGKTTTTSMIGYILKKAILNPTILVGAFVDQLGGNFCIGDKNFLVAEACEYVDSFLNFNPTVGIILNIDNDHLDYFKDIEAIKKSFKKFSLLVPRNGFIVANYDDDNTRRVLEDVDRNKIFFSAKTKTHFWAKDVVCYDGFYQFDIYNNENFLTHIKLRIPGVHNVCNALAAFATTYSLGVDEKIIQEAICEFSGASRRLEKKGEVNGIHLYDDYAHHPTEITTTLTTLKQLTSGKVIAIFQPHTFSRLKNLAFEFAKSLSIADKVIVSDVYAAREKNIYGVTSEDLYKILRTNNVDCEYIKSFDDIANYVLKIAKKGDIVATIGAGDINKCISLILNSTVRS